MNQRLVAPIALLPLLLLQLAQPAWTQSLPPSLTAQPPTPATDADLADLSEPIKNVVAPLGKQAGLQVKQATCTALSYGVLQEALLSQVKQTLIEQKANQALSTVTTQYVADLTKIGVATFCQP